MMQPNMDGYCIFTIKQKQRKRVMASSIASRWRELSGERKWQGLLCPLDLDLRRYIIQYGERVGAVGDLFKNKHSIAKKEEFFSKACLEKGNKFKYDVTHFFYAGSADVESSWFGYVAVTKDVGKAVLGRRDILVAWRGTMTDTEWINNARFMILKPASELFPTANNANVHSGFLSLYTGTRPDSAYNKTSARNQVLDAVRELVNKYQNEEISMTVAGYSLGGALATLNAMDIVANGYNKPTGKPNKSLMVTAFVYGGPRVGDTGLKKVFETLGDYLHLLRITNSRDTVPLVPEGFGYTHLGKESTVNSSKSNFLKWSEAEDNVSAHVLDVYLHGVAVHENGSCLVVDHDVALVNKYLDCLKNEYKIPPYWWVNSENRKKMVQMENGHWKVVNEEKVLPLLC